MKPGKVNCIIVDGEPVAREILENHLKRIAQARVAASCKNAVEAFTAIITFHVDLVFLDIQMPEISGLSFARSMNRNLRIIFTTAYREYAVDGFDLKAVVTRDTISNIESRLPLADFIRVHRSHIVALAKIDT